MRRTLFKILSPLNSLAVKMYKKINSFLYKGIDQTAPEEAPLIRATEYSFVIQGILRESGFAGGLGNVLDIGVTSAKNCLAPILSYIGYQVYGIDGRRFKFENPNFHFIQGDICHSPFPDNFFDYIYAVLSLEHVGLIAYHWEHNDPEGDIKTMKEIARIIRPKGTLLLTVPYGQAAVLSSERIYDEARLQQLVSGWHIVRENYYHHDGGILKPVQKSWVSQAAPGNAIALLQLCKSA